MDSRTSRKSRSYCFTINNPTAGEREDIRSIANTSAVKYIVCGNEVGGVGGTPHIQGYVYFTNPRTIRGIKRLPGFDRAHLESSRGTPAEGAAYCKKDGDFWEEGELPSRGRRSDLNEIKELIEEGKDELYIADNHFNQWVVYRRSFDAYRRLLMGKKRSWKSWTNVLVGTTRLGKTRFVYQQHEGHDGDEIYAWGGDRWFDGYCGQRVALLDDYRGELPIGFLLRLLDRYPMQVPVKGGFVNWAPRRIYITSNQLPEHWYDNLDRPTVDALIRRVDRLDQINEPIF